MIKRVQLINCSGREGAFVSMFANGWELVRSSSAACAAKRAVSALGARKVKRFVFCANTGRCGSQSLAKILSCATNAAAYHEPAPAMVYSDDVSDYVNPKSREGRRVQEVMRLPEAERFRVLFHDWKLPAMYRLAKGAEVYCETTQMFVHTFAEPAIETLGEDRVGIIHLYRNPVDMAWSWYQFGHFCKGSAGPIEWGIRPIAEGNEIQAADLLQSDKFKHPFYVPLWHWYNVQTKIARYRRQYTQVTWSTLRTEQLSDENAVLALCKEQGVRMNVEKMRAASQRKAGTREDLKEAASHRLDPEMTREKASEIDAKLRDALEARYGKNFWI